MIDFFLLLFPKAMSLPHVSAEDISIAGYRIPKNTMVTAFFASVHLDPKLYPNPEKFQPERFFGENYGNVNKKEMIIPFSVGRVKHRQTMYNI